jgi:ABC-type transporter Mla subunit MlaD
LSATTTEFGLRYVRLAGPEMRSYLATRVELDSTSIAVVIIDELYRFLFVVGRGIEWVRR